MPGDPPPTRVLIVRLSALGDCVHVLPALDALRRGLGREAHLAWLVEEKAASLLDGHPQLDRVHVLPRRALLALVRLRRPVLSLGELGGFFRDLRRERFEVALDFHSNLRSSIAVLASGARRRYGFGRGHCYERTYLFRNRNVIPRSARLHKVEKNFEIVRALGIDPAGARARVAVPEAARERAARFAGGAFGTAAARVVAFHPGASGHVAGKMWPVEAYAALARELGREGMRVLVTWGPGERRLAERIAAAAVAAGAPEGAVVLAPETASLQELSALYERCAAVVGSDTGPVHLAAALGAPVVGLYAPKDPAIYGPWSSRTGRLCEVVYRPRIGEITPADVRAALARAWSEVPSK